MDKKISDFKSIEEMERYYIGELEAEATKLCAGIEGGKQTLNKILDKIAAIKRGDYRKAINGEVK